MGLPKPIGWVSQVAHGREPGEEVHAFTVTNEFLFPCAAHPPPCPRACRGARSSTGRGFPKPGSAIATSRELLQSASPERGLGGPEEARRAIRRQEGLGRAAPAWRPAARFSSRRPHVRPGSGPAPGGWIRDCSWREAGRRVPRGSQAASAVGQAGRAAAGGRATGAWGPAAEAALRGLRSAGPRRGAASLALIGPFPAAWAGNCCFQGGRWGRGGGEAGELLPEPGARLSRRWAARPGQQGARVCVVPARA